jgi:thioredoxin 1|tara:strand:+ start:252 stop:617 length:366 start_codon:yes stop_codon:yes gene_type:complete
MELGLTEHELFQMQSELTPRQMVIIKFTADWCGPCQGIKGLVKELVKELPDSIKFYEIDIDESLELYAKFKSKKMVNGIPAILGFKGGEKEHWYIPDDSVLGGNKEEIKKFFARCKEYGSE